MDPVMRTSRRLNLVTLGVLGLPAVLFLISTSLSPPTTKDWGLVGAFFILDGITCVAACMLPAAVGAVIARTHPVQASALAGLSTAALIMLFSGLAPWSEYEFISLSLVIIVPATLATWVHARATHRGVQSRTRGPMVVAVVVVQAVAASLALLVVPVLGQLLVSSYQQEQPGDDSPITWSKILGTYRDGWALVALWAVPTMLVLLASAVLIRRRPVVGSALFLVGACGMAGWTLIDGLALPWWVTGRL
ncbi:MAG: hypothetical protein JWR11_1582 [Mycobacterium sp.]|nr:hypothetical protein [Mycobacterium sp.]